MRTKLFLVAVLLPLSLTACSGYSASNGNVKEWIAQNKMEQSEYEQKVKEDNVARLKKKKEESEHFNITHPEVEVTGLGEAFKNTKAKSIREAFNALPFVTRDPDTDDMQKVYVKVADVKLTLNRIKISMEEQVKQCQRIASYSGYDIETACFNQVGEGISAFASMIKDPNTPDSTKKAALLEATFGNDIEFEHASRLAKMHNEMCKKQGDQGYAEMVTVAVPCKSYKGAGIN